MKKIILITIFGLIILIIGIIWFIDSKRFDSLVDIPSREIEGSYEKVIGSDEAGLLVKYLDFDILIRGIVNESIKEKVEDYTNSLKGMDGGYNSSKYFFTIYSKNKEEIINIDLTTWPWAWESFDINNIKFTIIGYGKNLFVSKGDTNTVREKYKEISGVTK